MMRDQRRVELEDERRFLLDSIRDLDRERAAGDVDEDDHRVLRDGYVARAAAVLRELESGRTVTSPAASHPWWRRGALIIGTLAVAAGLGVTVAQFAGQRLPGQGMTGGLPMDEVAATLAQARASMSSDPTASLAAYDKVLGLEPDNVEAITYRAWLLVLGGRGANDESIIEAQLPELQRAIALGDRHDATHRAVQHLGALARLERTAVLERAAAAQQFERHDARHVIHDVTRIAGGDRRHRDVVLDVGGGPRTGPVSVATFLANRSVSDGRGLLAASPSSYRLRQIPPMSREDAFLSNFDGTWLVAQFLPITPQLVRLASVNAPSSVAGFKP